MHDQNQNTSGTPVGDDAARIVLAMARRLHKAARSESLAASLPVLRRVLASGALRDMSLPALRRNPGMLQRKHVLRTLAAEAGYSSWEAYRQALGGMTSAELAHFDLIRPAVGYPNLWFSTLDEAAAYALEHGGMAVRVGGQAVVVDGDPRRAPLPEH